MGLVTATVDTVEVHSSTLRGGTGGAGADRRAADGMASRAPTGRPPRVEPRRDTLTRRDSSGRGRGGGSSFGWYDDGDSGRSSTTRRSNQVRPGGRSRSSPGPSGDRRRRISDRSPIGAPPGASSGARPRSSAGQSNGLLIRSAEVRILPRARGSARGRLQGCRPVGTMARWCSTNRHVVRSSTSARCRPVVRSTRRCRSHCTSIPMCPPWGRSIRAQPRSPWTGHYRSAVRHRDQQRRSDRLPRRRPVAVGGRIFDGAYDNAAAGERPVYGALNFRRKPIGAAPRFGSAHLRLTAEAISRTTFCYPDSVLEPHMRHRRQMALIEWLADDRDPGARSLHRGPGARSGPHRA